MTYRPMATLGQSTPSTRDSDLPDPAAEKRELRRMVQELEAENERLRSALKEAIGLAPNTSWGHEIMMVAQDALDGGGEAND